MVSEPARLPMMQRIRLQCQVVAMPKVITLAIQCWKPQKMNSGTPSKIPSGVLARYMATARYIMTPQRNDLKKKIAEKSQVAILAVATGIMVGSVKAKMTPQR